MWLKAAELLNFSKFNSQDLTTIKKSQEKFNNQVKTNLHIIQENNTILINTKDEVQDLSVSLTKSFEILSSVNMAVTKCSKLQK